MDYDEDVKSSTRKALLSGALQGGGLGAIEGLLSETSLPKALLHAAAGAGIYGGASAGSTYLGNELLGVPTEQDPSGYTRHGALGGALGGAGLGAAAGALAGKIKKENVILNALRAMPKSRAAVLGALGLGTAGAAVGGLEGSGLDFLQNQMKEQKRRQMIEEQYGL